MKKSKTFKLFIISGSIILLTFIIATFWNTLSLGNNKMPLALGVMLSFGISIAGIIIGISELKLYENKKLWIALIGHSLIIILFLSIMISAAFK